MKTYMANRETVVEKWYVIDAAGETLGRLASLVAFRLRGKHRPDFTPHVAMNDHVIVLNAGKIRVTGNKAQAKVYHRHSGYPGGLKTETFKDALARRPTEVIEIAVKGMLPKNALGRQLFRHLKVYAGAEHPHSAQQPEKVEV